MTQRIHRGATTPVTPDKLSGLSLWLDAMKGVTTFADGSMQIWADQSPNINNAKGRCGGGGGCGGGTSGPLIIKSAIKGNDAIVVGGYNRGYVNIPDDPTLQFGTGPFAIIAVFAVQMPTSDPVYVLQKSSPSGLPNEFNVVIDSNVNVHTPTADAHAFVSDTVYHAVVIRGPALQVRIDGATTTGTTNTSDISYPASQITMGLPSTGSSGPREIDLTEYILVKGSLSDADVAGIELYLKNRYKFTF